MGLNTKFMKELSIKYPDIYTLLELVGEIQSYNKKVLFKDRYGELNLYPRLLLKGVRWSIQSATDKREYFLNMLKDRNPEAFNQILKCGEVKSVGSKINIETMYGELYVSPNNLLNGDMPSVQSAVDKTSYFLNMLKYKNPNMFKDLKAKSEFKNGKLKMLFENSKGIELKLKPGMLLEGHGYSINSAINKTEFWISLAKEKHGDMYDYSKTIYRDKEVNVVITCKKHGDFEQNKHYHISGNGCPICKSSRGEKATMTLLEQHNIKFEQQKTFDDCVNISKLKFDFYLPDYNTCIEINGRQHYEPVALFGGEEGLKDAKKRDSIKREYCKSNNIRLLEIPYTVFNNLESEILTRLNINNK